MGKVLQTMVRKTYAHIPIGIDHTSSTGIGRCFNLGGGATFSFEILNTGVGI